MVIRCARDLDLIPFNGDSKPIIKSSNNSHIHMIQINATGKVTAGRWFLCTVWIWASNGVTTEGSGSGDPSNVQRVVGDPRLISQW